VGPSDARSPFTASGDTTLVVDPQDSNPVILDIRKVAGALLRLVNDISMSGIIAIEEIPFACATRSISLGKWWARD